MTRLFPRPAVVLAAAVASVLLLAPVAAYALDETAAPAAGGIVYQTIPSVQPVGSPSLAFAAHGIHEYGSLAVLGGTARGLERVEIALVSWACEKGYYHLVTKPCVTGEGTGFEHPVRVNIYAENEDGTLGELLGTREEQIFVPFRPSSDDEKCEPLEEGHRFYDEASDECHLGLYFVASFDFSGLDVRLPDRVIVSTTFNTSVSGYEPLGADAAGIASIDLLSLAIGGAVPAVVGTVESALYVYWKDLVEPFGGPVKWSSEYTPHIAVYASDIVDDSEPERAQPFPIALAVGAGLLVLGGLLVLTRVLAARRHREEDEEY